MEEAAAAKEGTGDPSAVDPMGVVDNSQDASGAADDFEVSDVSSSAEKLSGEEGESEVGSDFEVFRQGCRVRSLILAFALALTL